MKRKKKCWLGLDVNEAFTEPIKTADPEGKISKRGLHIDIAETNGETGDKKIRGKPND